MNNDNSITVETKLYGYIAEEAHSSRFSVTLNKLYKGNEINAMIIPMNIRPDDVAFTISQMRTSKLNGAVLSSEYQEEALLLVDHASMEASESGYCDFITIENGKLFGDLIMPRALTEYADRGDFQDDIALRSMCQYIYDLTTGERE